MIDFHCQNEVGPRTTQDDHYYVALHYLIADGHDWKIDLPSGSSTPRTTNSSASPISESA